MFAPYYEITIVIFSGTSFKTSIFRSRYFKGTKSEDGKVKHELRVTSYKFKSTSYEFKSTSYEFKGMGYEFRSTSYVFKSTS